MLIKRGACPGEARGRRCCPANARRGLERRESDAVGSSGAKLFSRKMIDPSCSVQRPSNGSRLAPG